MMSPMRDNSLFETESFIGKYQLVDDRDAVVVKSKVTGLIFFTDWTQNVKKAMDYAFEAERNQWFAKGVI